MISFETKFDTYLLSILVFVGIYVKISDKLTKPKNSGNPTAQIPATFAYSFTFSSFFKISYLIIPMITEAKLQLSLITPAIDPM